MKVLVTGVDGYIGSMLAPMLIREGHSVVGIDAGFYREGWLFNDQAFLAHSPATSNKDIRDITREDLDGVDAIVHLAELSNDPLGENNPEITYAINHRGSVRLAELAKELGIGDLSETHWKVINFMRSDFKEKGQIPTIRRIKNAGGVPTKDVYACFPEGPAKKSAMISGLGKPQGCV